METSVEQKKTFEYDILSDTLARRKNLNVKKTATTYETTQYYFCLFSLSLSLSLSHLLIFSLYI